MDGLKDELDARKSKYEELESLRRQEKEASDSKINELQKKVIAIF
jgi:hypothetical protein